VSRAGGRLHGPDDAQVGPRGRPRTPRYCFCKRSGYWFATISIVRSRSTAWLVAAQCGRGVGGTPAGVEEQPPFVDVAGDAPTRAAGHDVRTQSLASSVADCGCSPAARSAPSQLDEPVLKPLMVSAARLGSEEVSDAGARLGPHAALPRQPMEWILRGSIVTIRRVWSRPPYHGYGAPR